MHITQTVTTLTLNLTNADSKPNLNSHLERLIGITEQFQEWSDPLSKQLQDWTAKVICQIDTEQEWTPEFIRNAAVKKIDKLVNRILVNPFNNACLRDPVLDGEWVWERSMLEDYLLVMQKLGQAPRSPFNVDRLLDSSNSHEYAKQMLAWVRPFIGAEQTTDSTALTTRTPDSLAELHVKSRAYQTRAKQAINLHQARTLAKECKQCLKNGKTNLAREKRALEQAKESFQHQAARHEQSLQNSLEAIFRHNKIALDHVKTQVKENSERLAALESEQDRVESRMHANESRIRRLHTMLAQCEHDIQNLDTGSSSCTLL